MGLQQPLFFEPASTVSGARAPSSPGLGVVLAFSLGLSGLCFWHSPGLLLSALPSVGWLHPVRKGGAAGEERWGAPGRGTGGGQYLDICQSKQGQPSPRHKGLSVRTRLAPYGIQEAHIS